MSDTKPAGIRWNQGDYSLRGYAGTWPVSLFEISWRTVSNDKKWTLRTSLPGLESRRAKADDRDALCARAMSWLAEFVAGITAQEEIQ